MQSISIKKLLINLYFELSIRLNRSLNTSCPIEIFQVELFVNELLSRKVKKMKKV